MKKIIALIDSKDLTEEQINKVLCLYSVEDEKIGDFTVAIDKIHDESEY